MRAVLELSNGRTLTMEGSPAEVFETVDRFCAFSDDTPTRPDALLQAVAVEVDRRLELAEAQEVIDRAKWR